MPIVTDISRLSQVLSSGIFFIFSENDIFITQGTALPTAETFRMCIHEGKTSAWYFETELDYTACMLKKDCKEIQGCSKMPLRQFFWDTKTESEKHIGMHSKMGNLAARAHAFLRLNEVYVYCPSCGTKMQTDETEAAKICPHCGRKDFPHIEPAVIVLVKKGEEFLLVKNKNRTSDFYGCVSGFVEHGESLEECVKREVMEETGIAITNIRYAGSQAWPFPDQLMLAFTADYKSGTIKMQEEELDDADWFHKDKLPVIPRPGSVAYNLIMGCFDS